MTTRKQVVACVPPVVASSSWMEAQLLASPRLHAAPSITNGQAVCIPPAVRHCCVVIEPSDGPDELLQANAITQIAGTNRFNIAPNPQVRAPYNTPAPPATICPI